MNWNFLSVACAALAVLGLSGCDTPPDGPVIRNPTVDEMNQMDSQMGLKPKPASPTSSPVPTPGVYVPDPAPAPVPAAPPTASAPADPSLQSATEVTPELQKRLGT